MERRDLKQRKPWQKILYEDQGYPDDHVDGSFLEELRKNLHVRSYSYSTLVSASTSITQQLSSVGLFVAMFLSLEDNSLSPHSVWLLASILTVLGYIVNWRLQYCHSTESPRLGVFCGHVKTAVLFQGFSASLSPVLSSLTETISTDTIQAMTSSMFAAYLLTYNYQNSNKEVWTHCLSVPGPVSLNAAVFASVCLASRLHTAWHAFTVVTVSFELFALWPVLQNNIKDHYSHRHVAVSLCVSVVCTMCLCQKTLVGAVLYVCAAVFVTLICPAWLCLMQPLKNNIYGPWDEAVVKT